MKRRFISAAAAVFLASVTPAAVQSAIPAEVEGQAVPTLAPLIKRVAPAVVNIATRGTVVQNVDPFFNDPLFRRFFDAPRRRQFQSAGSGVIVDARRGYILTNHHVIENADEITVTLMDDRTFNAEVVGSDPGSDVAVLKVEERDLVAMPLGDSDSAEVGDFVIAIGNPFGLQHTVTSGIISGLGRSGINPDSYEDFIQTDASINPGNSGGALVSLDGQLLGINSAILSRSGGNIGIGFAIPVNMARSVMDQILEFGEVRRGLLGVNIYTVTPDIAEAVGVENIQGALVSQVAEGSAAEAAGLEAGDIIVAVNDEPVKNAGELRNRIGLMRVGDRVRISFVRESKRREVTAELSSGSRVARSVDGADIHRGLDGAQFTDLGDSATNGRQGVLIAEVDEGSPAAQRGLRTNDVVTRVNQIPVTSVAELREATAGATSLVLNIRRGNQALILPVR